MKFPPNCCTFASILPLLFAPWTLLSATYLHGQESRSQPIPQPPAETFFSGPQPGEPAEGFEVLGVLPPWKIKSLTSWLEPKKTLCC